MCWSFGVAFHHPRLIAGPPAAPGNAGRVVELARAGIKVFHLCADQHGRERLITAPGRHITTSSAKYTGGWCMKWSGNHAIVSGGIALAEHMAKAIICGADLVAVDTPLLVALGCRVCRNGHERCSGESCPAEIGSADRGYAAQRMVNLMGAWHDQLIEVLGPWALRRGAGESRTPFLWKRSSRRRPEHRPSAEHRCGMTH
jgi:hypothetical protein